MSRWLKSYRRDYANQEREEKYFGGSERRHKRLAAMNVEMQSYRRRDRNQLFDRLAQTTKPV